MPTNINLSIGTVQKLIEEHLHRGADITLQSYGSAQPMGRRKANHNSILMPAALQQKPNF